MAFGRTVFPTSSVFPTRVSADGAPQYKPGGVTFDWSTVTAAGSDTTLPDGSVIRSGSKYLRYGQVIAKIGADVDTVTITGSPTGGTFTLTVTIGGAGVTTAGLAYNAAASAVQTALVGLSNVGTGNATVTGSAGGPYTVTFADALGAVTLTASGASLTGGTSPGVTIGATATGGNKGWFGIHDPAAADGRQTLTRGSCYVIDQTILQYGAGPTHSVANDHFGEAIEGGLIYIDRVLQSGTASHSAAAGPTLAEFLAAFPTFRLAQD